ncbi:uncharacterized protein LOC141900629 [Tubulanus polymorphus]|uniref:uncharacterized protein LOC141900629 n=1 Tax=Tubulanus polymorphus TaxID=672921 RepID=UPI003DA50521
MTEVTSEVVKKFAGIYLGSVTIGTVAEVKCTLDTMQKELHQIYYDFIKAGGYYPHRQKMIAFSALELKVLQTESVATGKTEPAYLYGAMQFWDSIILRTFKSAGRKMYGMFESLMPSQVVQTDRPKSLFPVKDRLVNLKHPHVPLLVFTYTSSNKKNVLCHLIACQSPEQALEMSTIVADNRRAYSEDYNALTVEDDSLFVPTKSNYENWRLTEEGWRLTHTKYPDVAPTSDARQELIQNRITPPTTLEDKRFHKPQPSVITLSNKDFIPLKGPHSPSSPGKSGNVPSCYKYDGKMKRSASDASQKSENYTPDLIKNVCDSPVRSHMIRSSSESSDPSDRYEHRWNQVSIPKQHKRMNSWDDNEQENQSQPQQQNVDKIQPTVYKRVQPSKPADDDISTSQKNKTPGKYIPNYMRNGVKVLPTIRGIQSPKPGTSSGDSGNRYEPPGVASQYKSKSAYNLADISRDDEKRNKADYDTGFGSISERGKARKADNAFRSRDLHLRSKKDAEIDSALSSSMRYLNLEDDKTDAADDVDFERSLGYLP